MIPPPHALTGRVSPETLPCSLGSMAWPTQRLQIEIIVRSAVSLSQNMIDGTRSGCYTSASTHLAYMFISQKDTCTPDFPGTPVTTFMSAFTVLIVAPSFTGMLLPMFIAVAA